MQFPLEELIPLISQYGYAILFPITIIEGPIATLVAGFVVSMGLLNFTVAYIVVVLGDLVGDIAHYALGRWGGKGLLLRFGRHVGIKEENISKFRYLFEVNGGRALFLGKLAHGVGGVFLVAAGIARMPFAQFLFYNSLATLLKSFVLLLIGYYFGSAISKINSFLEFFAYLTAGVLLVVSVVIFVLHYRRKEKNIT